MTFRSRTRDICVTVVDFSLYPRAVSRFLGLPACAYMTAGSWGGVRGPQNINAFTPSILASSLQR